MVVSDEFVSAFSPHSEMMNKGKAFDLDTPEELTNAATGDDVFVILAQEE